MEEPRRPSPPSFIVVEGNNGVGKTTIAASLRERLDAACFHYPEGFVRFRERVGLDVNVGPAARLAYYRAATIHLSDLVRGDGQQRQVVCGRYLAAPLSLLMADNCLAEAEIERSLAPVQMHLCVPDVTVFVRAGYASAIERIRERAGASDDYTPVERHMLASAAFFARRESSL